MKILHALFLGLIQGLTEFLPVSSSGHLILAEKLGIGTPSVEINLFLHLSTLLAVVIVFRKPVFELIRHPFSKRSLFYIVACVPTATIAFIVKKYFYGALTGDLLPFCFMFTAALLLFAQYSNSNSIKPLSYKSVFLTGVMQGIAVLPGISRSGSTMATLILQGTGREEAKEFSFLLSIPIILGGALTEIPAMGAAFTADLPALAVAAVAAFFSGLLSVKLTARVIDRGRYLPFSIYLVLLSVLSFIVLY